MSERYLRHSLIDWFDQERIRSSKAVVVGAGAVGNEVLKNLALLGVGNIHIVDADRIEEHNLTRCVLFRESDIGNFKAAVAAAACRALDSRVKVTHTCTDLWEGLSLDDIATADAVLCCVDNFEARLQLNRLCLITATNIFNVAIDSRAISVEEFPFAQSRECACFECNLPHSIYEVIQRRFSCGWLKKVAVSERKIPTTTITSSLSGAMVVSLMLHRINGQSSPVDGAFRYFQDSVTLHGMLSSLPRSADCPTCSRMHRGSDRLLARRMCPDIHAFAGGTGTDGAEVLLSEPVLTHTVCTTCQTKTPYFESVRKLTDQVTFCARCKQNSCVAQFVERLSLAQFESTFGGQRVACKFLTCFIGDRQVVVELEN